jgi:Cytochrome P460
MKRAFAIVLLIISCMALLASAPQNTDRDKDKEKEKEKEKPTPQYNEKGDLLRPADFRDWEFLSAGFGMSYSPAPGGHEMFTNVFVQRWAYQEFLASGKWPEQSMFVIDERDAESRSSINQKGHYQTDRMGLAVEVKDAARFPDKWGYFGFGPTNESAGAMPKGNPCTNCHEAHAAVEHTFVQFYPTLKPVAKKFGVYNQSREQVTDASR